MRDSDWREEIRFRKAWGKSVRDWYKYLDQRSPSYVAYSDSLNLDFAQNNLLADVPKFRVQHVGRGRVQTVCQNIEEIARFLDRRQTKIAWFLSDKLGVGRPHTRVYRGGCGANPSGKIRLCGKHEGHTLDHLLQEYIKRACLCRVCATPVRSPYEPCVSCGQITIRLPFRA